MWPLIVVSSFAVAFVLWLTIVIWASPRRQPADVPGDPPKVTRDDRAVLFMMMSSMMIITSAGQ